MTIEYSVDYQYLPKNARRPRDGGEIVGIKATDKTGVVLLPDVGDFVYIDNSADGRERDSFHGRVRSRLFIYERHSNEKVFCHVNIVVEETDNDLGLARQRVRWA